MRFSRALFVVLLSSACAAGCRQADGAWPNSETGDTPNRLHDLTRDLQNVAAGDAEAPKEFADDLAGFAEVPAGVSAARNLADGVTNTIRKRTASEDACKQMASILWKSVASRQISERQVDGLKDDMRGVLPALRPPDFRMARVSFFSGFALVISAKSETVIRRRPALVGL